jgi:hypothetical protein
MTDPPKKHDVINEQPLIARHFRPLTLAEGAHLLPHILTFSGLLKIQGMLTRSLPTI